MPSRSVADIFADFRLARQNRQFANEQRIKENPKAARIEQQKRVFLADKMALLLEGKDTAELDEKTAALENELQSVIEAEVALLPVFCTICGDKGITTHGTYCKCFLDELYRSLYGALPPQGTQGGPSFEAFDETLFDDRAELKNRKTQRDWMLLIRDICRAYIADFPRTKKPNMLLSGSAGLGKSWTLSCMARAAWGRGIDVLYIRAGELFQSFFAHRMGEEIPLSFLHSADLMLIDDLGTEPITQNVSTEYFYDLLNKRMEGKKHTVIASNIRKLSDFSRQYGERIASRLGSWNEWQLIMFEGQDVRLK